MYDKEKIDRLAKEYIETEDDEVFTDLLKELISVIRVQLGKLYADPKIKVFWDDLQQDVCLILWKNRKSVIRFYKRKKKKLEEAKQLKELEKLGRLHGYYYGRIRPLLHYLVDKYKQQYDAFEYTWRKCWRCHYEKNTAGATHCKLCGEVLTYKKPAYLEDLSNKEKAELGYDFDKDEDWD